MVSIIVPVYESWHLIPVLIAGLREQIKDDCVFEVILVDNGSSGATIPSEFPAFVRTMQCEMPGSYAARNAGVGAARGDTFVFTDADCVPQPGWLRNLTADVHDKAIHAGRINVAAHTDNPNLVERYDTVKGIPQERYVRRGYAATANLAVSRKLFLALGGFDASRFSGGDADFCRRAVKYGADLKYIPEAVVDHPARSKWRELVIKARRVKGGQVASGSFLRRLAWLGRTILPPVMEWQRALAKRDKPFADRVLACALEGALWGVCVAETVRLVFGGKPERR